MAKKENENARVVKFLVQYNGLKDLLKRTNIQKILAGNASFTGSMAESDLDALKAAQRYVELVGRNLRIGNEGIDQYFSRLQGVYTGADLSKRVSIHDANYPAFVAGVLDADPADGVQKVAQAIDDNEQVKKAVANLPLTLGKEKGLSYVATMTHYLALSASISGLNGNITELQNANMAERDKNKRLSEIIAERNKRLADLEKVDAGFVALMEQSKKTASQESVDALAGEVALLRTSILESVKPVDLDGVKKSIKTAEQTLLKRMNATDTHVVDGLKDIAEQIWGANALTLTAIDSNQRAFRRAIGAAQARGISETRQQGNQTRQHVSTEAVSTRAHVTTEADRVNAHTTAEADRVIAEFNKVKPGWGGRKHPVRDTLIVLLCAFGLVGGGLGTGYAIWGTDDQASSVPPSDVVYVDNGYQEKYDQLFASMGVDFKHYNDFVNSVNSAKADDVISRTEYAELAGLAAEPASTADFPRTQMETAVLDNAIYSTELAQYDAVKAQVDGYFADKTFSAEEQADVQAAIDGYNAENIEGKFNSSALMAATFDTAKEYSELNVLYNNLLNAQPGTETPAPNYSGDMKTAMETLQVALSDKTLSEQEIEALDEIIAKLDATGDDNAELFAEKLDSVIDTFVAQQVENAQLSSDKAAAEQGKADAEAERDEWKAKYDAAQAKADELEENVQELTDKVAELETTIATNTTEAAKKYAELEALYNKAVADYEKAIQDYNKLLSENESMKAQNSAQIVELQGQLVAAGQQIESLNAQIAQSQDIILDYYYEYTGKNGTLEEALAFFAQTNSNQGNQQGSSSADPEAPSYGK